MNEDFDHRLIQFGYAPGGYLVRCWSCDGRFTLDKRATRCEPCAVKKCDEHDANQVPR